MPLVFISSCPYIQLSQYHFWFSSMPLDFFYWLSEYLVVSLIPVWVWLRYSFGSLQYHLQSYFSIPQIFQDASHSSNWHVYCTVCWHGWLLLAPQLCQLWCRADGPQLVIQSPIWAQPNQTFSSKPNLPLLHPVCHCVKRLDKIFPFKVCFQSIFLDLSCGRKVQFDNFVKIFLNLLFIEFLLSISMNHFQRYPTNLTLC